MPYGTVVLGNNSPIWLHRAIESSFVVTYSLNPCIGQREVFPSVSHNVLVYLRSSKRHNTALSAAITDSPSGSDIIVFGTLCFGSFFRFLTSLLILMNTTENSEGYDQRSTFVSRVNLSAYERLTLVHLANVFSRVAWYPQQTCLIDPFTISPPHGKRMSG